MDYTTFVDTSLDLNTHPLQLFSDTTPVCSHMHNTYIKILYMSHDQEYIVYHIDSFTLTHKIIILIYSCFLNDQKQEMQSNFIDFGSKSSTQVSVKQEVSVDFCTYVNCLLIQKLSFLFIVWTLICVEH